ncbi:hypothetical protein L2E82_30837 [Cichorium intybus]|uniref:Uncharacterized protein n=1 Tax=Cichorium intybus TaxID=13427 RepID=A0ACB9D1A8_CICIN|nr:hypothetical protein L2E82_30837 [Cichorium intybus]
MARECNSMEAIPGSDKKVSFFKLFSFADRYDVMLMLMGTLGAIGFGMQQPIMSIVFGQLVDTLGTFDNSNSVDKISKVCTVYLYMAMAMGIASFLQKKGRGLLVAEHDGEGEIQATLLDPSMITAIPETPNLYPGFEIDTRLKNIQTENSSSSESLIDFNSTISSSSSSSEQL